MSPANGTLSGLQGLDLVLLFIYSLGAALILRAVAPGRENVAVDSSRRVGTGALGVAIGIAALLSRSGTRSLASHVAARPTAPLVAFGSLVLAIGFVDLVFMRVAPRVDRILRWLLRRENGRDVSAARSSLAALCTIALVASVLLFMAKRLAAAELPSAASSRASQESRPPSRHPRYRAVTLATFDLPGSPLAVVFRNTDGGYIALAQGEILRFELATGRQPALRWQRAADGLGQPRGLAIIGDQLFVTEIVSWACSDPPTKPGADCYPQLLKGVSTHAAEERIIEGSHARISQYAIRKDGSLGPRRTLFDDLPIVNNLHGLNEIVAGPDGRLYASFGGVDELWNAPQLLQTLHHPNLGFIGTIVRFRPEDAKPEIFARGFRNVFGLTFGAGKLYGVDNDGQSLRGWRGEQLLLLAPGGDYGYPALTNSDFCKACGDIIHGSPDSKSPVMFFTRSGLQGSAGVAWAPLVGLKRGLIIGRFSQLDYVELDRSGRKAVSDPDALDEANEYRAVVVATPDGKLLVGGPGPLRLLEVRRRS